MSKEQIEEMARTMLEESQKANVEPVLEMEGKEVVLGENATKVLNNILEQAFIPFLAEAIYNADFRKQVKGEWIEHSEIGAMNDYWKCSACRWKTVSITEMRHSKFCPNCGARMKGGDDEN